ncbi:hypothetical protein INR49_024229 [Caranx melampygus]|nr:hypothetical protein INR49_024229 [Caranx melampygus]
MEPFKWLLFLAWLFFKVGQSEASSWTNDVPSSVKGVIGSCVVIPCSFNYPDPKKKVTKFTGIWTEATSHVIYHPVESKIMQQYRGRTELLGDVAQKNCSLKIDHLRQSDRGPFYFRIEIEGLDNFSFKERSVSVTVVDKPNMTISVKKEVLEGETVTASCSVSPFCPISPSVFSWSHSGEQLQSQQFNDGQWKATATLTFRPTHTDHNKSLLCNITLNGGRHYVASQVLKVKYAPVNVKVEYKADVKEGETVQLKCSSDAHPPASTVWHNESGAELHQGNIYMLPNVSRHTGALYCTAINTVGQGKSSPVHISVLHAPEIKPISSCSSEGDMVKCMCIVESKPSCMVHFVLSDRILTGTKVEKHGSVTIGTLQGAFQSSKFIQCLANNTEGNATLTLSLPVSDKMQNLYIVIAVVTTVVFLVVLITTVGFVKKCRGNSGNTLTHHMNANMAAEEFSQYTTPKRKEMEYDDVQNHGYDDSDHIYGNIELVKLTVHPGPTMCRLQLKVSLDPVVIPCSFDYPDPDNKGTTLTGIWKTKSTEHVVYHPNKSKIMEQYQDKPNMAVSVKEEVLEGETVTASCSVSPFCPTSVFSWSHSGEQLQSQQFNDGQWKATATLTFRPTHTDHNKPLLCNLTLNGGRQHVAFQVLKVKYAPVNVKVEYKADVKEGETVQLKCSGDAHPPASTVWHNESGAELHQGNIYMLPNVSRHIGALYCTAINTAGQGKSSPVHISVLHAPEIKPISSCSSEGDMVKCMCIVESKPSCMVHFVLSDRILTGTKVEKHGSVTMGLCREHFNPPSLWSVWQTTLRAMPPSLSLYLSASGQIRCRISILSSLWKRWWFWWYS